MASFHRTHRGNRSKLEWICLVRKPPGSAKSPLSDHPSAVGLNTSQKCIIAHLEEERRVLEEDSYVDDILTSHNSREELIKITQGVENILKAGDFILKPWVLTGQSGKENTTERTPQKQEVVSQDRTIILPNQMKEEDNKALGVGYQMEENTLCKLTAVNFSKRRRKIRGSETVHT